MNQLSHKVKGHISILPIRWTHSLVIDVLSIISLIIFSVLCGLYSQHYRDLLILLFGYGLVYGVRGFLYFRFGLPWIWWNHQFTVFFSLYLLTVWIFSNWVW